MSDIKDEERPEGRRRRDSDSFLCFKPNGDDRTLMRLKHAENKWNFERQRRQTLEEENEKLKTEIAEAGNVQRRMFWQISRFIESSNNIETKMPMLTSFIVKMVEVYNMDKSS